MPKFIIKAGKLKYREDFETPMYSGRGSVTSPHVQEAQMLLEPGVFSFARLSTDHGATFIVNSSRDNRNDVAEARVADYIKSLKGTLRDALLSTHEDRRTGCREGAGFSLRRCRRNGFRKN